MDVSEIVGKAKASYDKKARKEFIKKASFGKQTYRNGGVVRPPKRKDEE